MSLFGRSDPAVEINCVTYKKEHNHRMLLMKQLKFNEICLIKTKVVTNKP